MEPSTSQPEPPRSEAPLPESERARAYAAERRRRRRRMRRVSNSLYRTLRFVAEHVQGVYSAYAAFLSIAFVGAAALAAFMGIAKVVLEGFVQGWDDATLRWIALHRSPRLDMAAMEFTMLGTGLVLSVVTVITAAFLWLTRHRHSAYLLLASFFGAWILNAMLKDVFERPRPLVVHALAPTATYSFPSGHAMSSMAAYGAIALLATRLEPDRGPRMLTWFVAAFIVLGIGASRLYLGVHYPSDVLGGYAAGLAWVAFAAAGVAALRYFGRREPAIREQEDDLERPGTRT